MDKIIPKWQQDEEKAISELPGGTIWKNTN
jgi:hypothetical protein